MLQRSHRSRAAPKPQPRLRNHGPPPHRRPPPSKRLRNRRMPAIQRPTLRGNTVIRSRRQDWTSDNGRRGTSAIRLAAGKPEKMVEGVCNRVQGCPRFSDVDRWTSRTPCRFCLDNDSDVLRLPYAISASSKARTAKASQQSSGGVLRRFNGAMIKRFVRRSAGVPTEGNAQGHDRPPLRNPGLGHTTGMKETGHPKSPSPGKPVFYVLRATGANLTGNLQCD